ncbi:uncharacterized protein RCO7_07029 [Rhynchosporium graminicola]|uniref:Nuclear GTPase SLIP-GC n=1 Tax=Rhynchosporium graminicola TaxID=2792576 RepID=A0A1E1K0D0_9HELO|nr:uncharacterized protein RCO7_07029 [Rhynchosporium commune]
MTDLPTPHEVDMGEPPAEIKLEPNSASIMHEEPDKIFCAQPLQKIAPEISQPETTVPLWKNSPEQDRKRKVLINEEAAEHAYRYFIAVKKILKDFSHIQSSQSRLKDIDGILTRKKECKVRIGFLGGTGSGKSSLINALLKEAILPRSDEAASTAVAVEVSYNASDNPQQMYRAYIEGISEAEFVQEIDELFADKLVWDQGGGLEAGEVDFEMHARMNATFTKVKCLFPKLQVLEDLKKTSANELLVHPEVKRLLDAKYHIKSPNSKDFTDRIQGYIEANSQHKDASQKISVWPLVKLVRIYTKAAILKPGIILVDLPGNLDTSAARVAVAEEYRKNLTISVIVAPAVRASSDKSAHDLLSSAERRTMQLDGLYKSDSLFFVVTKIDDLQNFKKYVKDHPNMEQSIVDLVNNLECMASQIDDLEREHKEKLKPRGKLQDLSRKYKEAHQTLAQQVEKILDALSSSGMKRKRIEDCQDSDFSAATTQQKKSLADLRKLHTLMGKNSADIFSNGNELFSIQESRKQIEEEKLITECNIRAACIQNRNQVHRTAIQAEYDAGRAMMGKKSSWKELSIFSVSSDVFACLHEDQDKDYAMRRGFFNKADTGIPGLRNALIATTWETRERNALTFNEDAECSLARMKLWVSDNSADFKMSRDEREHVESRLNILVEDLEAKFSKLRIETSKETRRLIETGIITKLFGFSKVASQQAKEIVTNWALLPWNNHRATNKRRGVWKSGSTIIDWNLDLAGNYLDLLVESWTKTIHSRIRNLQKSYERKVEAIVFDFCQILLNSAKEFDPAINEAICLLKENILHLGTTLQNSGADNFADVISASKDSHRLVQPRVLSAWEDVYDMCGAEKGAGVWNRNRRAHQDHVMNAGGQPMYKGCGFAIKNELRPACDEMSDKFDHSFSEAVNLVKEDLRIMLERHTVDINSSVESLASTEHDKRLLQQALAPIFTDLERAWGMEPLPEVVEEDEVAREVEDVADNQNTETLDLDALLAD